MKLINVLPHQQDQTLEEFYTPSGLEDPMWTDSLLMMRSLVQYLEQEVDDSEKHVSLQLTFLHMSDPSRLGGITVSAWNGQYKIEYTIPPHKAPWKHANVVGYTPDIVKAVEMLYQALSTSDKLSREYASFFE
ncbi:MAG: hypothetical protein AAGF95_09035 [Chloroflexota bacterium]